MVATESLLDDGELNPYSQSYFGNNQSGNPNPKSCFGCGKAGHKKSNCPDKDNRNKKQPRGVPKVKKF